MAEDISGTEFYWENIFIKVCGHFPALSEDHRYHAIELRAG